MSEDTKINEFDHDEWREVARAVRPDITDETFDEMWSGFVEMQEGDAMSEKDGGAAFPTDDFKPHISGGGQHIRTGGMSLRDYFASRAPQPPIGWLRGKVSASMNHDELCQVSVKMAAEWSYLFADAMLAHRDTTP